MKKFLISFSALVLIINSCADPYGVNDLSEDNIVVTGDVVNIGSFEATMYGSFLPSGVGSSSYRVGFIYSTNPNLTTDLGMGEYRGIDIKDCEGNTFSGTATKLGAGLEYYYRAILTLDGNRHYGEVKKFRTQSADIDRFCGEWYGTVRSVIYRNGVHGGGVINRPASLKIYEDNGALKVAIPIFIVTISGKMYTMISDIEYKVVDALFNGQIIANYNGIVTTIQLVGDNEIAISQRGLSEDGYYYYCVLDAYPI